jgi:lipoprotein-anchoring transpeptidase ErfK/SrfK
MLKWKYPLLGGAALLVLMTILVTVVSSCRHASPPPTPETPVALETLPSPAEQQPPAPAQPQEAPTATMLTDAQWAYLQTKGWDQRVTAAPAVWISVDEQVFRFIEGRNILWEVPCSTAAKGTGSTANSMQTPLGWHLVKSKTGANAPWGQVFRSGHATAEIWKPGQSTKEDLVLTRVLFLDGTEPGINKGGNVDSFNRKIYIHGTNDEARIGTPISHGCIRLRNDDAIQAYNRIPENTPVLITER